MTLTDFGVFLSTLPDALRLLIVPVFAWLAWKDIKTRRVANRTWIPLLAFGGILFAWDAWTVFGTFEWQFFVYPAAVSLFVMVPAAYLLWFIGAFGGADAKAIMTLAVFFPIYPSYYIGSTLYPMVETDVGVFSFTILSNAVAFALLIPVALAALNVVRGDISKAMFFGYRHTPGAIENLPGRLLETQEGFTRSGLDLDALRMYLRWRGTTIQEIQSDPHSVRHPATIPDEGDRGDPTDGAIRTDGEGTGNGNQPVTIQEEQTELSEDSHAIEGEYELEEKDADWWGAEAFLNDVEYAYGTEPEDLRTGLEVLIENDDVWVSPGTPFLVPIFAGLLVALLHGNILFTALHVVGVL